MTANGHQGAIELETFLPSQDGSDGVNRKFTVVPPKLQDTADLEYLNQQGKGGPWDPFKDRDTLPNATTNCDTLTHLLKAALGTGILAMPVAFKSSGLFVGIIATIIVSVICTHCSYILVKCAHELYHRTRVSTMSFADVGEIAFASGPPWGRKFGKLARRVIHGGSIAAYFGACSVYCVFIAENLRQVIEYNLETKLNERMCIAALWIPLILLSWVPNLKKLAPISMVANLLMAGALLLTFYFLVWDLHSVTEIPKVAPLSTLPEFFSITIFALEVIGVVMPLENAMKTPKQFLGVCGVLNQGMGGVTLIFLLLGFLGYLKYGDKTQASITLNIPTESIVAQVLKIFVALSVYCTYGLQYFVFMEIVWNGIKDNFNKASRLPEYIVRTILTSCTVILAIAIPSIGPFIALIGALCFSFLGLMIPVLLEFITYWDKGFGPCYWMVWKNVLVFFVGVMALIFGTYTSILKIMEIYMEKGPITDPADILVTTAVNMTQILNEAANSSIITAP